MNRYLHFLWTNRFSILLSAVLLLGAGWFALQNLPESVFPNVNFPRVAVLVNDGSLPVKFMEVEVTKPLEALAKGQPGVRLVRSQTGNGLSKLNIYFEPGTNPQTAYLMLQARLAQYRLPAGAQLRVIRMAPYTYPLAQYALVSNRVSSSAMMPSFAFKLRPALLSIPGVYQVQETGRGWPQVQVHLDPARLAQYHLSAQQVITDLQAAQGPFFSGVLQAYHQQLILATTPRPENAQALAALTLPLGPVDASGTRTPLALGTLGDIHTGPPSLLNEAAVPGYKHALIIDVLAQPGVNDVNVAHAVQVRLDQLRQHLPQGVHLVPIYDLSHLISHSLRDVWIALGLGSLFAWLVIFAFLGRLDGALATVLVVPLALAATFLVLHILGYGLNIMTLGGLTAAIGALVDHAIVVIERGLHGLQGQPAARRQSALRRSASILPVMSLATLTSSLVFLPLLFLSGTLGLLFRHMALAIVIALLASQLVALLVTPILTAWLAGRSIAPSRKLQRIERWLRRHYSQWLIAGMRRPYRAILPIFLLTGTAWLVLTVLPTAFLPRWDEGIISVPYRTQVGSSVAETAQIGRSFMQVALRNPNVQSASLVVGRGFEFRHAPANKGAIAIVLKANHHDSAATVMAHLRQQFRRMAPNLIGLSLHQTMIVRLGNLSGAHAPLVVYLFGSNSSTLRIAGKRLAEALKNSHDFAAVNFKSPSAGPEMHITPSPMATLYGITPAAIADQLKTRFWGRQAGFLLHGEQILPIRVTLAGPAQAPQSLSALPIQLPDGEMTSLSSIASVHVQGAVPFVTHQNLVPDAYMWLEPKAGEGLAQAARQVRKIIAQMHLPGNITPVLGGYYRQQRQSFQQMALILGGALGLLLILLGFQFNSQRAALAALLSIALAAPGSFLLVWLCGLDLDSTAFLGVLLVFAIAVNNVILIFARARQLGGTHPSPALVVLAARQRLRPVLMTMLADVFGFLPLAIGIGHGTELLKPLAIAVMGGLMLSIFMSLWLAPVLYSAMMMKKTAA
ncbi:transporter [Acidithiobacillus marinus]|uniref:Transporter n=1 Tax=Acidithiobacillus marinus TaxID=187490 RepID=A0A2I1DND8_9PROT|nr:efflux RND transporter permease subunit [Acidithiobacillus marinus]PKY11383.1 transporter [Acidithiobacillus marinus]